MIVVPALIAVAISGRMHGIGNSVLRLLSYPFLGFGMLLATATLHGWIAAVIGTAICLLAFALGHGNFFAMNGAPLSGDAPEEIERYGARWIFQALFGDAAIYHPAYSWWCMGTKWMLIGLCAVPYGLLLGLIGPMAYAASFRYLKTSAGAEWFTTIYTAIIIAWVFMAHPQLLAERLGEAAQAVSLFSHGDVTFDRVKFRYGAGDLHAS